MTASLLAQLTAVLDLCTLWSHEGGQHTCAVCVYVGVEAATSCNHSYSEIETATPLAPIVAVGYVDRSLDLLSAAEVESAYSPQSACAGKH